MRYNKVVISTVMLSLLATGCVKPTDAPNQSDTTVYNEQPATEVVYEDGTPIVYADPNVVDSGVGYGTVVEETVVSTGGYEQPTGSVASSGPFDDPYGGGVSSNAGSEVYVDPYSTGGGVAPSATTGTYTENIPYNSSPATTSGGIHLQIAALKDYYSAEEFKNGLSLDPRYSAYVKKGAMSKVIVTGFSNRSEALTLRDRQFPGAFIVAGSSSYSGGSSYTPPSSTYTPPPAYNSPPAGSSNSGIGVQIGAFSSQSAARNAAESAAAGRYTAIVKTVTVRGKTLYKAILLGFNSRAEAKSAIASGQIGNGFVVSNIYP
ncbi:SPOR domain-containing protein [Sulfurovum sp. bin170]|uniref:SPOR domain-containing protein n=1 Tax=Sulfurovum sp. bin170 TaxID=2695268 RepID=UPI0013DFC239|nr:SPOR domain-containing protein [Sulfurovum sp. bin170]NEW60012.1 SPOR domain-containing protein [Sulfurovum sp. bin170]